MRSNRKFNNILVETDNPEFLEEQVKPANDMFRLDKLDAPAIRALRQRYVERQRHYTTAPFDPEGNMLRFFPGGFTIWSGEPGSGKTTMLRQLANHLMYRKRKVFVCSLEEDPEDVFMRHVCTAMGTDNPSDDAIEWCADTWLDLMKIWNYSARDSDAEHAKILAAMRVLAREEGLTDAILDSFMCLDVSATDIEAQRKFAGKVAATCAIAGIHLHLVAHPRKRSRSDQAHTQEDVAGSADLARKADNIVFAKRASNEKDTASDEATPMMFTIMKQRFGLGRTGDCVGWFNRIYRQFSFDQFQDQPIQYLCNEAYKNRIAAEPLFLT